MSAETGFLETNRARLEQPERINRVLRAFLDASSAAGAGTAESARRS